MHSPGSNSKASFALSLVLLAALGLAPAALGNEQNLHALRGAYLYYFAHFIRWPSATTYPEDRLLLCALTDDERDRFQLNTLAGKTLGEKRLQIEYLVAKRYGGKNEPQRCHILYVTAAYSEWLNHHAMNLADNTLLVTEGPGKPRGLIHLFTQKNKLKFEIDRARMMRKGFKVSSKLLRLSKPRSTND